MTAPEARRVVVDGLVQASIGRDFSAFLDGSRDIDMEELALDSLARMELCIFIELKTGLSLAPDDLDDVVTLAELASLLERHRQ